MPKKDGQSNTSDKLSTPHQACGQHLPPRHFRFASGDVFLIIAILVFCGILITGMLVRRHTLSKKTPYVRITVDGSVVMNRALSAFADETEYRLTTENGEVVVILNDHEVYIQSSDCPDQICVQTGKLTKPGDGAICLPNKIVVQIVAGSSDSGETDGKVDAVAK